MRRSVNCVSLTVQVMARLLVVGAVLVAMGISTTTPASAAPPPAFPAPGNPVLPTAPTTPAEGDAAADAPTASGEDGPSDTPTGTSEDGLTEQVADDAGLSTASWMVKGANAGAMRTFEWVLSKSTPVVNGDRSKGDWFAGQYQMMMNIGWWIMLPLLFVTIIHSIIKGSMQLLLRSVVLYLPLAVLGTVVATQIIQLLIVIVDDLCLVFVGMIREDLEAFMVGLNKALLFNNLAWVLQMVLALALVVITAFLGLMFLMRDSSIYMGVMFMPVGFAMMVWPMAARYFRKMVEFLVGIILSKLVMVIIISLAVAALAGGTGSETAGERTLNLDGNQELPNATGAAAGAPGEDGDGGLLQHLGYILPALVMLLLAAVSPPMTVRLVGNMGLQEMAGQVAGSLDNQAWLYQYIGMDRMTKIFIKNPVSIYNALTEGRKITKANKKTTEQEKGLKAMGFNRHGADHKYAGTYKVDHNDMADRGFVVRTAGDPLSGNIDAADYNRIVDGLDPNKNATDANEVAVCMEALRQGPTNFKGFREAQDERGHDLGTIVDRKDGRAVIVLDISDRRTGKAISHHDGRLLRRVINAEAERQVRDGYVDATGARIRSGRVQGIQVRTPVQTTRDAAGRTVAVDGVHKKGKNAIDRAVREASRRYASDDISATYGVMPTVKDTMTRTQADFTPAA